MAFHKLNEDIKYCIFEYACAYKGGICQSLQSISTSLCESLIMDENTSLEVIRDIAIRMASRVGSVDSNEYRIIENIIKHHPLLFKVHEKICALIARRGRLDILNTLKCKWGTGVMKEAAREGYIDILKRIDVNIDTPTAVIEGIMREPSINDDLPNWEILEWLNDTGCPSNIYDVIDVILRPNPHLHTEDTLYHIIWSAFNILGKSSPYAMAEYAALYGRTRVLELMEEDSTFDMRICEVIIDNAVKGGHIEIIKKYLRNDTLVKQTTLYGACLFGDLSIVEYLYEHSQEETMELCYSAASKGGHIDILEWLYSKGLRCNINAYSGAAYYGHLDVVKWLYEHKFTICTHSTYVCATINNHIKIINWLYEELKIPYDSDMTQTAAEHGHLNILKFVPPDVSDVSHCCWKAAQKGHIHVVEWLCSSYPTINMNKYIGIAKQNWY